MLFWRSLRHKSFMSDSWYAPPSLFMLLGVSLIQMASRILLVLSWFSQATRRVPSQSITCFSLPAWSVIADLLLVCLESCFGERGEFPLIYLITTVLFMFIYTGAQLFACLSYVDCRTG